ncbi:MAG TPA: rod shape-determining protein RodA [bacterium]|nr:rod shape-determining protein RodA [bacterium]
MLLAFILSGIGIIAIYSATYWKGPDLWDKQFISVLLTIPVVIIFRYIDYKILVRFAPYIYLVSLLFLGATLVLASPVKGARRWLYIGGFNFQPSELIKLALILVLADLIEAKKGEWSELFLFITCLGLTLIPFLITAMQPDLGTAVILMVIFMVTIFVSQIRIRYIIFLIGLGITSIPLAWKYLLMDYQKERILTFLNPNRDPLGAGYHIIQSKLAIGSGGLLGYGFLNGPQNRLKFIPEQHTDFIFSLIGEEFGFIGSLLVIILFLFLFTVGLYISSRSDTKAGLLMGVGIISMLCVHVFINIGMTIGLLPVTGIPLPFISYGRSGLMVNMMGIGILSSISKRRVR